MEIYRDRRYYAGLSYVFFQIRVEKVIKLLQRKFWEGLDDVTKGGGDFLLSYNGDFRRG